ncbi:CRISPR system precrRNA processing endoribonuclease RAMP protein Cas6 [Culturomica massiliensis]|uniref:CRISPR system precrRNA processing endoribonuclease RAMP protein Cas6 n=1 Tax=Culturomica massiliensis TaxID=1841857 RepID=UPI000837FF2D|nr:CRISPR system precrRNA processing endoribonuclease RAMP protein Cas6 [Culturomica massiliensis]
MENWNQYIESLVYHRLEVRIMAKNDGFWNAWPGAVIRNNLLYACANVCVRKDISLLDVLERFPLKETHPLYKNLTGGFPKGLVLKLGPELMHAYEPRRFIRRGEILSFSLLLIGNHAVYYKYYVEALRQMCARGIGHPMEPFNLVDICERHPVLGIRRIASETTKKVEKLQMPVTFEDFARFKCFPGLTISFQTPVLLHENRLGKVRSSGYQEKLNGFPSYYQFVRSVAFRSLKLAVLYVYPENAAYCREAYECIDHYLERACIPLLQRAALERISLAGTPKEGEKKSILFHGYIGEIDYSDRTSDYRQLMLYMQELGVGNDTIYGLGQYRINSWKNYRNEQI